MSYDPQRSIDVAKSFLGYHEGANNYNQFSPWQGLAPNNPWCASFVSYCAVAGGLEFPDYCTFGTRGDSYCPTFKTDAERWGLWRERYWHPTAGDFVLYDWQNDGVLDHIEMVLNDDGTNLVTIGGNVGNAVAYRTRNRANVGGFIALSESGQLVVKPKVASMFSPYKQLAARLRNPGGGGQVAGWWEAYDNGLVDFLGDDGSVVHGGMCSPSDVGNFAAHGEQVASLVLRPYGAGKHGYTIIAQDGNTYVPSGQH